MTSLLMLMLVMSCLMMRTGSYAFAHPGSQGNAALPPIFTGAVEQIEPSGEAGAWVLQVISRGGFNGRTTSDLLIRSDGSITRLTDGNRATAMRPDTLVSLNQRIRTVATPRWDVRSRLGICSDCRATVLVLAVRESNGLVTTYSAFWDTTTEANVPYDLQEIYDLARGAAVAHLPADPPR